MSDKKRVARYQRLEKVRVVAKQAAATEAARAEGTLAQLQALAARTGSMVADYAARTDIADAAALQQLFRFRQGLQGVASATTADAERARSVADHRMTELASAERRRQAAETRATAAAAALAAAGYQPPLGARRETGTGLE